jgi:hypothetical protein
MSGVTLLALVEESFVAAGALAPLPAKTAQTAKAKWTILISSPAESEFWPRLHS